MKSRKIITIRLIRLMIIQYNTVLRQKYLTIVRDKGQYRARYLIKLKATKLNVSNVSISSIHNSS